MSIPNAQPRKEANVTAKRGTENLADVTATTVITEDPESFHALTKDSVRNINYFKLIFLTSWKNRSANYRNNQPRTLSPKTPRYSARAKIQSDSEFKTDINKIRKEAERQLL